MLDFVITWVDGSDEAHQQKKNKWAKSFDASKVRDDSMSDKRFDDSNELYYCIHLIRKNASFVRKIFLITDEQRPQWLSEAKANELGVVIVDHKDIFGSDAGLLPVFNSTSIEGYIHNIEGLSEKFVYLNDDFFIIKPVEVSHFVSNDKLVLRGSYFIRGFNRLWRALNRPLWLPFGGLNTCRALKQDWLWGLIPFCRAHAPYVCDKTELSKVFSDIQRRNNAEPKFRTVDQLNPLDIHFNRALKNKVAKIKYGDWFYMTAATFCKHPPEKDIRMLTENKRIKFLCVQELCEATNEERSQVLSFLDSLI